LEVGLCIWRLVGVMKKDTVRLATKEVEAMGVDRHAKSRAIRVLEQDGLIGVERKQGRFPIVTVMRRPNSAATYDSQSQ
jgi:DNA-binding MarR family transcriptional regulator